MRPPKIPNLPITLLIAALIAPLAATPAAQAQVTISSAWVRAPAPGQDSAAAYLTISSARADTLTGVDAEGFGMAMMHATTTTNGVAQMNELDSLPLPPGQPQHFAPGGKHIMLMDWQSPPKAGSTIRLTLHFAHTPDQTITAPVRPLTATGP